MLLAVDVGNTNLTIGLFDGERLAADWRLKTDLEQTPSWGALFHTLVSLANLKLAEVDYSCSHLWCPNSLVITGGRPLPASRCR